MNKICILMISLSLGLVACAPKLEERVFAPPQTDFGPQHQDSVLKINQIRSQSENSKKLSYNHQQSSTEFFSTTENLLVLSQNSRPELQEIANRMIENFYDSSATTSRFQFGKSLYLQAAIGETQADAKDAIFNVVQMLNENVDIITQTFEASKDEFAWPKSGVNLDSVIDFVQGYLTWLQDRWQNEKIDPRVFKALVEGIHTQSGPIAASVGSILHSMSTDTKLIEFISHLEKLTTLLNFDIDDDTKALIAQGVRLISQVDLAKDEADGLAALVAVWRILSPEERLNEFNAASPPLYNFLKNASESQLKCLEGEICGLDIITLVARDSQIRPQIKAYGVDKLKAKINAGAVQYATSALVAKVTPMLKEKLPGLIEDHIRAAFKDEEKVLAGISKNLKGFLAPSFESWSKNFLLENSKGLNGLEYSNLQIQVDSSQKMKFSQIRLQNDKRVGAAGIGSAMSALVSKWQLLQPKFESIPLNLSFNEIKEKVGYSFGPFQRHMQELLSEVNKALAIGGFRISDKERFPALARAINPDGTSKSNLDLKTFIDNPISFAVPNALYVTDAFRVRPVSKNDLNVDIGAQAALLRGLSKMTYFFRDWESNSFDRLLGNIKLTDLVTDERLKGVEQKIFPKDIIFTLMIGDAAVILENFTKSLSPILRLDEDRNTFWQNEASPNSISAMATLVNWKKGQRAEVADASALSAEMVALIEFYHATEGIEKTNSTILRAKDKSGQLATLKSLADGRKSIFLLITAMANFITHELQDPDGGVYHSYNLVTKSPNKAPRELHDQVAVIRALTLADQFLSHKTYVNSALDIYYFMNRNLWVPSESFYANIEGQNTIGALPEVVDTLSGIETLTEDMPKPSLNQWNQISEIWYAALKGF